MNHLIHHLRVLVPSFWFAALLFALMPVDAWQDHFMFAAVVMMGGAAIAAVAVWQPRIIAISQPKLLLLGAAFWVLALASVVFSEAPGVSIVYFCFFSTFPISALVFYGFNKDTIHFVLKLMGLFYAVLSIAAIVQFFVFPDMLVKGLVAWPLSNPNSFAGLLSLGFFGALGVMMGAQNRVHSNLALIIAMLVMAALIMTGSRGAFVALAVAAVLFLIWNRAFMRRHVKCLSMLGLAGIAVFIGVSMAGDLPHAKPTEILTRSIAGTTPLLWTRPEIWLSTLAIARDYFWTGTGIGTFFLYYPEYRGDDLRSAGLMAHSDPLQFWAEMGVFAIVLFYAFVAAAVWRCFCAVRGMAADDARRLWILTPFCALGAMIAHTHLSFHFNILPILCVAGAMLGVWLRAVGEADGNDGATITIRPKVAHGIKTGIIGIIALVMIVFAVQHSSDMVVTRGRTALNAGDSDSYIRDINLAGRISQQTNPRAFVSAALLPLGVLEQQGAQLSPEQAKQNFDRGMDLLEQAERYNPRLSPIYLMRSQMLRMGQAHLGMKDDGAVEESLLKGVRINPLHLETRMALARFYLKSGREEEAYQTLKAGAFWPYDSPMQLSYYQLLAQKAVEHKDDTIRTHAMDKLRALFMGQSVIRR